MKLAEINKLAKDNVVKPLKDNGFKREKMLDYIFSVWRNRSFHYHVMKW